MPHFPDAYLLLFGCAPDLAMQGRGRAIRSYAYVAKGHPPFAT